MCHPTAEWCKTLHGRHNFQRSPLMGMRAMLGADLWTASLPLDFHCLSLSGARDGPPQHLGRRFVHAFNSSRSLKEAAVIMESVAAFAVSGPVIGSTSVRAQIVRFRGTELRRAPRTARTGRVCMADGAPPPKPTDGEVETTLEQEEGALDVESGNATVVRPDTRLAGVFTFAGGFFVYNGDGWLLVGFPLLLLGIFLYIQTSRIRFVFGPTKLNVASRKSEGKLNFIRGWAYDTIAVWDIYPSPSFPILAYFREKESYLGRGSIHFFPILADGQQLVELFNEKTGRPRGDNPK